MGYRTLIFDMDGTILETLEDLADALNAGLSACGFPMRTTAEVRNFVGNGIRLLVERGMPEGTDRADTDRVFAAFRSYYAEHCSDKTHPYPGICNMIARCRADGYRTAVVSNKVDDAVGALCRKYFDGLFDYAVGERAGSRKKPAPDSVFAAMRALDADTESTVYIGDSNVDLETAHNAGLPFIGVSWGFRDRSLLESMGAKCVVDTADELYVAIREELGEKV